MNTIKVKHNAIFSSMLLQTFVSISLSTPNYLRLLVFSDAVLE